MFVFNFSAVQHCHSDTT